MNLKFLYITDDPEEADFVESQGVDLIFIDMEYIGKSKRQPGDSVKNFHTVDDVISIKKHSNPKNLLVRINPYGEHTKAEIDSVVEAGATHIMLPMISSLKEVTEVSKYIKKRVAFVPLIETVYSLKNLEQIIEWVEPEFIFFGLNDLYRELELGFIFGILAMNLLDHPANICKKHNIKFGFGGISKFDYGLLNSRLILNEHIRLGSSYVILSRDFTNNIDPINFFDELRLIRDYVEEPKDASFLLESSFDLKFRVRDILNNR